jgi:regulator of replication initiation timing
VATTNPLPPPQVTPSGGQQINLLTQDIKTLGQKFDMLVKELRFERERNQRLEIENYEIKARMKQLETQMKQMIQLTTADGQRFCCATRICRQYKFNQLFSSGTRELLIRGLPKIRKYQFNINQFLINLRFRTLRAEYCFGMSGI